MARDGAGVIEIPIPIPKFLSRDARNNTLTSHPESLRTPP